MASINKLSIRGVRAFSPEDQEQVLEFLFPVTIIVGSNGCGKTTVIEALKYAVTGSLPPGNKSGQAFVHDPKSIGQSQVKANIKLRFTNKAGKSMVVVRSMELTQKKSTMSFKALDGVLRMTDERTNERISLSHKCTELDRQIPLLLGVSKPILEHVIFCHQEDSSWPLMEGAVLKKRFDDIFDSTKYAKALKAITETKKEYNGIVKDLKADLAGLAAHKTAAQGFRQELEKHNQALEELEEDLAACRKEIQSTEQEHERNRKITAQIEDLRLEQDERRAELTKEESVLEKQLSMLAENLTETHSARQLKDRLRDFEDTAEKKRERRQDVERDLQKLQRAMDDIRQSDVARRQDIGKLHAEKESHEALLKKRLAKMDHIAQHYGIELSVTQASQTQNTSFTQGSATTVGTQETAITISAEDMQAFYKAVEDKEEECKEKLRSHKRRTQEQEDHIQEQLSELNAKIKAIEHDKNKLETEMKESKDEIKQLTEQAGGTHSRVRKQDIEDTKRQADKYAKERDAANNDPRLKEIPIEIRSHEAAIDKAKRAISYDTAALKDLRQNNDAQQNVTILKGQIAKELETLQEAVQDQSYPLQQEFNVQVPNPLPDEGDDRGEELIEAMEKLEATVRDKYETKQVDLAKAKSDYDDKQRIVSEKSAMLNLQKQTVASLRSRLDQLGGDDGNVGKFQRIIGTIRQFELGAGITPTMQCSEPQQVLSYVNTRIEELEASLSDVLQPEAVAKVVEKLIDLSSIRDDNGEVTDQICPCCRRQIVGMDEAQVFQDSMAELKDTQRSELVRADTQLTERNRSAKKNYQRWKKTISECLSDAMEFNRITAELKTAESKIDEMDGESTVRQNELSELQETCSSLQGEVDKLRDLVDMTKGWSKDANSLARKKEEISRKELDLTSTMTSVEDRDLETVENDLARHQHEKDELMEKIARLNTDMTDLNSKISRLSQLANRFEIQAQNKQTKYNEEQAANLRKNKLTERVKTILDEVKKLTADMNPLRKKAREKETERSRFRHASKDEEEGLSNILNSFSSDVSDLRRMTSQIDDYVRSNKGDELERLEAKLASLAQKMKEKKDAFNKLAPELERIKKDIENQERQKKLIKDNLDLLESKEHIKVLKNDLARLNDDINQIEGHDTCVQLMRECEVRKAELFENRARYEGRRSGMIEQIRTLQRKLKTPDYKDIDERHRVVMIKHETTQIAVSDLDKYYVALDNALLRFHGMKIAEINRIIRELWQLTYKGEDITNVELKAGAEGASKAKKSYNYRVVMTKGSTQLDMRGRCSAGQRVLASLVIRLALAETFCVSCGCMALDEPTTNLDYNNKRGLAIALAQIIAHRAHQANFQLILITHDEDFVGMMKTELSSQTGFDMPDKYYQLRREESADGKHYSKVDVIDWDELV